MEEQPVSCVQSILCSWKLYACPCYDFSIDRSIPKYRRRKVPRSNRHLTLRIKSRRFHRASQFQVYAIYYFGKGDTRNIGSECLKIVGDGNETNEIPFLPRWRGVLLPPPPLFLVNRNQNGARDLWESG